MNKRRVGFAAAIGLGVTALLGVPRVTAQDPAPEPKTAAEADGAMGRGVLTYSVEGTAETNRTRTAAGDADIEFVALGAGCRAFDTRGAQGPLVNGQARTYSLQDGDIASQGGTVGGCEIPVSAVAVDMSLSTLANSPTAFGFVRAGQGGATPTATVLQFLKNQGTSVTTTVPLDPARQIRLLASGANTGMTGDVLGYWERTLHATINADGSLELGSGVVSISKFPGSTGAYTVEFERDVSACTPVASGATSPFSVAGAVLNSPSLFPKEVFVKTTDTAGDRADRDVHLVMEC